MITSVCLPSSINPPSESMLEALCNALPLQELELQKSSKIEKGRQKGSREITCKVELVQEDPVAGLEGRQQRAVTPGKLSRQAPLHRKVRTKQIHDICLFAEIDTHMPPPCS